MEPFIITGDLQVRAWQQFSHTRKDGMNSRLYYCLKVFDIILKTAKERKVKRVLLNGDILEDNGWIEVNTYNAVYRKLEMLHEAGLEVVINLGNHDVYAELGGRIVHSITPLGRLSRIVEEPQQVWKDVWCVPWMANPRELKRAIASIPIEGHQILVSHCGVQGARTGPTSYLVRNPIKLRDVRPREFRLVLLSDYHTRQKLASNVVYLGSPLQHTFGEIHRPCIWIVSKFQLEKVYTNLPQFHRIKVSSVEELKSKTKEQQNGYYSIKIPEGSSVGQEAIEKAARSLGLRFDIEVHRETDPGSVSGSPLAFDAHRAIRRYVKRAHHRTKARLRLLDLGVKLYEGKV